MTQEKILVTGACGQIGTELVLALAKIYGNENVVASDIRKPNHKEFANLNFEIIDVMNKDRMEEVLVKYKITDIYHLAAMLSATAEKYPMKGWDLNMQPLLNILEFAKDGLLKKVYWPSSIAVFGVDTPADNAPQDAVCRPSTVYGISKVAGEMWCQYYHEKHGVDVRSIRYPGLVSWKAEAGGGTTDYAVEVYYKALLDGKYTSFLSENMALPMMYMNDAIRATIGLMRADSENIKVRSSYNINGFSITGKQVTESIQKILPNFEMSYAPDFREEIAATWPNSIDDSVANKDWGWKAEFDVDKMTEDMLLNLTEKLCDQGDCVVEYRK